MNQRRLKIRL